MANVVGEVQVRVVPDGSTFGPQLQAILDKAVGQSSGSTNVGVNLTGSGIDAYTAAIESARQSVEELGGVLASATTYAQRVSAEMANSAAGVELFGGTFGDAGGAVELFASVLGQAGVSAQRMGEMLWGSGEAVERLAGVLELAAQASEELDAALIASGKESASGAATFRLAAQQANDLAKGLYQTASDSVDLGSALSRTGKDAAALGEMMGRTGSDAQALGAALGGTATAASGMGSAANNATSSSTAMSAQLNAAGASAQQATTAFNNAGTGAQQLAQIVRSGVGGSFAEAAVRATAFTGAVFGSKAIIEGVIGKLSGLFDQLAQAQAGFAAITGERKGDKLLGEIRQFAKESPFVTQQLVNYSQQLLGVGVASERIVPLLKDTGNVIASVGGDTNNLSRVLFALTQIQTMGRLQGQDAMQLQTALIPITRMLSEYLGKSQAEVKKMQEQGKISAEAVFGAIQAAGQKVPTAMDNAVRNIAGARSVLSDTITIMMQDAPALNMIYDDIVKGIQTVAAKLGEPQVTEAARRFFESIQTGYEALKPAIAAFISTAGGTGLSTIRILTTVLGTFADVLGAIPTSVLETLAKVLATLAMIRAPMMLMRYIDQFRTMAGVFSAGGGGGLLKGFTGLSSGMTAADAQAKRMIGTTNAQTQAMRRLGVQVSMTTAEIQALAVAEEAEAMAQGASTGLGGLRQRMGQQMAGIRGRVAAVPEQARGALSGMRQNMGGVASMGALMAGTMISSNVSETNTAGQAAGGALTGAGMGFMLGGPVGAAAGAAIGAVIGWMQASEAEAEEHARKMAELGEKAATDYLEANEAIFRSATGKSGEMLQAQIRELEAIANSDNDFSALITASAAKTAEEYKRMAGNAKIYSEDEIAIADSKLKVMQAKYDDLFLSVEESFKKMASGLPENIAKTIEEKMFTKEMGRRGLEYTTNTLRSWSDLESVARYYGLTLDEVGKMGGEAFGKIVTAIEQTVEGEKQAILYANRYNAAAQDAAGEADALYGGRKKMLDAQLSAMGAEQSAMEASLKAFENQSDRRAKMQAESAAYGAQSAAYIEAYNTKIAEIGETMDKTSAQAIAKTYALRVSQDELAKVTVVATKTLAEMSKQFKIPQQELIRILGLQSQIKTNMKIAVTADTQQALERLAAIAALMKNLAKVGMAGGDELKSLAQEKYMILKSLMETAPPPVIGASSGGGGGGGGAGQSFADKVEQAGKSLEASIKSAMQSAEQAASAWKGSVKQRTQYEQTVSAQRALSNVRQQQKDITFLTSGIAQLKQRGLTEEALANLDINALTDVKQVKKLLAADPTELARLSSAIAERDRLASTLSFDRQQEQTRKTITQAIVEAAKLLGYKVTEEQAKAISASFNIVSATDVKAVASEILKQLSGGKVTY